MDATPSTNGFKPATLPLHWVEIGKLVKEFMLARGNTVTIHEVRKELADAGVPHYSEHSFDKWYKRLFIKPKIEAEPKPAPLPEIKPELKPETELPVPPSEVDDEYIDKALTPFVRFVGVVGQIGGIRVAESYLKAMREIGRTI